MAAFKNGLMPRMKISSQGQDTFEEAGLKLSIFKTSGKS